MTHLYSQRWMVVLFVSCAVLSLSGYRPTTVGRAAQGTPSSVPVGFGPGSFILPEPTVGLAALASYKATLTHSFEGTKAGQPSKWTKTYVMLATKVPPARQLTIDTPVEASARVFVAERDGAAYEYREEDGCSATAIDKDNPPATRKELAGFLYGVLGATEEGNETVNDVAAKHYTFDERALGPAGVAKATGEMWVASDGGYLVRYVLAATANAEYFGEGIEGILTWNYELSNINKPVTIELPKDCPSGMVDVPLLPDAADVVRVPGRLSYSSHTSVADVAAFYQKQLVDLGWKPGPPRPILPTTAILEFTKDVQQLLVAILVDGGTTTVNILLDNSPQVPSTPKRAPTRTPRPTSTRPPTRTPVPTKTARP